MKWKSFVEALTVSPCVHDASGGTCLKCGVAVRYCVRCRESKETACRRPGCWLKPEEECKHDYR